MVRIFDDDAQVNAFNQRRRKGLRVGSFTSSASLILSWPFPLIVLCFHSNRNLFFDSRIFGYMYVAFLFSGFLNRFLLQQFLPPTTLNAIIPAVACLIGNSVFVSALYNCSWNWGSVLVMVLSRLLYGWSTYSAEDFNRRAFTEADRKQKLPNTLQDQVSNMTPDLHSTAFHVGVIISLVICLILEVCLRHFEPQMAEFYCMLILSGASFVIASVSAPCVLSCVRNIMSPANGSDEGETFTGEDVNHQMQVANVNPSMPLTLRQRLIVSTLFHARVTHRYPRGQIQLTIFSSLLTASTVVLDYLLLPYMLIYIHVDFISPSLFPFVEITLLYFLLFLPESVLRYVVLHRHTACLCRLRSASCNSLTLYILFIALVACLMPTLLALAVLTMNSTHSHGATALVMCVFCFFQGLLKVGHTVFAGILFAKFQDATRYPAIVQTGEQLVGLVRCFLSGLFLLICAGVLHHQGLYAALQTVSFMHCCALAVGTVTTVVRFLQEPSQRPIVDMVD